MPASDLHISAEMTGDRAEDTDRRAQAYGIALEHARTDPLITLKMALGKAYSDVHAGDVRTDIIKKLRKWLAEPGMQEVAVKHCAHLSALVRARTIGERCGDYVSKVQLQLLKDAMVEEATDA